MIPTLIVLTLLALGVGIVAWATRRKPAQPVAQPIEQPREQDTAWNDPITPADASADPFANALTPVAPPAPDSRP